jgi:hypothetical protein
VGTRYVEHVSSLLGGGFGMNGHHFNRVFSGLTYEGGRREGATRSPTWDGRFAEVLKSNSIAAKAPPTTTASLWEGLFGVKLR